MITNKLLTIALGILTFINISPLLAAQPEWNGFLDFEEIEERLKTEAVVNIQPMHSFLKHIGKKPSGIHPIKIVELESGLLAVFKPQGHWGYGEVAAYKASKILGIDLVPPTIMRTIKGRTGSLQFYVSSPIDLMRGRDKYMKKLSRKQLSDMKLFYMLMRQNDTHAGNQIIAHSNGEYNLALIDNAHVTSIKPYRKANLSSCSQLTYEALKKFDEKQLEDVWSDLLAVDGKRVKRLITLILRQRDALIESAERKNLVQK